MSDVLEFFIVGKDFPSPWKISREGEREREVVARVEGCLGGGGWHRRGRWRARAGGKGRRKLAAKWRPRTNSKNKSLRERQAHLTEARSPRKGAATPCALSSAREWQLINAASRRVHRAFPPTPLRTQVGQSTRDHHRAYTTENSETIFTMTISFPWKKERFVEF